MIADVRMVQVAGDRPFIQIRPAVPVADASGVICGFELHGWRTIELKQFDGLADFHEAMAMDDLAASGGIVDAP